MSMKHITKIFAGIALAGLILACEAPFNMAPETEGNTETKVVISVNKGDGRTVRPSVPVFTRYKLILQKEGGAPIVTENALGLLGDTDTETVYLSNGNWTITIEAFRMLALGNTTTLTEVMAARGSKTVPVAGNEVIEAILDLYVLPIEGGGKGVMSWDITLPTLTPALTTATITLKQGTTTVMNETSLLGTGNKGRISLDPGYYDLFIFLIRGEGNSSVSRGEYHAVQIYSGLESPAVINLSDLTNADFTDKVIVAAAITGLRRGTVTVHEVTVEGGVEVIGPALGTSLTLNGSSPPASLPGNVANPDAGKWTTYPNAFTPSVNFTTADIEKTYLFRQTFSGRTAEERVTLVDAKSVAVSLKLPYDNSPYRNIAPDYGDLRTPARSQQEIGFLADSGFAATQSQSYSYWTPYTPTAFPHLLTLDFGSPVTVSAAKIYEREARIHGFKLEVSNTGDEFDWTAIYDESGRTTLLKDNNFNNPYPYTNASLGYTIVFEPVSARFFRLNVTSGANAQLQIWELLLFNAYDRRALHAAVAEAQAYLATVKPSDDGEDVLQTENWANTAARNAFSAAINTAKTVLDNYVIANSPPSQDDLDAAVLALETASGDFTEAVDKGKMNPVTAAKATLQEAITAATTLRDGTQTSSSGNGFDLAPYVSWVTAEDKAVYSTAITTATTAHTSATTVEQVTAAITALANATTAFKAATIPNPGPQFYLRFQNNLANELNIPATVTMGAAVSNAYNPSGTSTAVFVDGRNAGEKAIKVNRDSFVVLEHNNSTTPIDYNQSFTIAFWAKYPTATGMNDYQAFVTNKNFNSGGDPGFSIHYRGGTNARIRLNSTAVGGTRFDLDISPSGTDIVGQWVHVAVVWDKAGGTNGQLRRYYQGALVGSTDTNLTGSMVGTRGGVRMPTLIGAQIDNSNNTGLPYTGEIHMQDFLLVNSAYSTAQITALYNGTGTPSAPPPPALALANPTFNPPAGSIPQHTSVTINGPSGAEIWYTLGGSIPVKGVSTRYTGPIPFDSVSTPTIRAIAVNGDASSRVVEAKYTVVAPELTITPATASVGIGQLITLNYVSPGRVIWYTLNGSEPAINNGFIYSGPFPLNSRGDVTVKAKVFIAGTAVTDTVSKTYSVTMDAPTVTPSSVSVGQEVTITAPVTGVTSFYYTTDGSSPDGGSAKQLTPAAGASSVKFTAPTAGTLNVRAIYFRGTAVSPEGTGSVSVIVPQPSITPAAGSSQPIGTEVTITITPTFTGSEIYYTDDGTTPSKTAGKPYNGPFKLDRKGSMPVRAIAYQGNTASALSSTISYNVVITPPVFDPGVVESVNLGDKVTLTSSQATVSDIYYTDDGTAPTLSSKKYTAPIDLITGGQTVIKAITAYGTVTSDPREVSYQVKPKKPKIEPENVFHQIGATVTITRASGEERAEIWYTTDGTAPSQNGATSTKYESSFQMDTVGNFTVRAVAVIDSGVSLEDTREYRVYAVLSQVNITFNGNGGNGLAPIKVGIGQKIPAPTSVPTRAGAPSAITDDEAVAGVNANNVGGLFEYPGDAWAFVRWETADGTPWDFANDLVGGDTTLYARWNGARKLTQSTITDTLNFTGNLGAAGAPRKFVYAMAGNESINPPSGSNVYAISVIGRLTIIGLGTERQLRSDFTAATANGSHFYIWGGASTTGTLVLGKNVNVIGRTSFNGPVVCMAAGTNASNRANLIMLPGSKITGASSSGNNGTAVRMQAWAEFNMKGGEISGNTCTTASNNGPGAIDMLANTRFIMEGGEIFNNSATGSADWVGGAITVGNQATFIMRGGVIRDNNGRAPDVYVHQGATQVSLSGDARIRSFVLNGDATLTRRYGVSVDSNWTGRVEYVFLRDSPAKWVAHGTNAATPSRVITIWDEPYSPAYDPDVDLSNSAVLVSKIAQFQKLKEFITSTGVDPITTPLNTMPDLTGYAISIAADATRGNLVTVP